MGIRLIHFDGKVGILRCSHLEKEHAIELLHSIDKISSHDVDISTIATSGTIRSLMKKHMVPKVLIKEKYNKGEVR